VSDYRVETGHPGLAGWLAGTLLTDHGGGQLPGLILHVGGGTLQLDEMAMGSLRVKGLITVRDGAEVLRAGGDQWDVLPLLGRCRYGQVPVTWR
jgi:hypothetical protein